MANKKNSGTKDNRQTVRVPIQLLVDYRSGGNYLFDFCRDLGTGGVFIETNSPLPTGSAIELTFTIPDSKETLKAKGKVIWSQPRVDAKPELHAGMGVQFSEFSADQRSILESFLQRHHGSDKNKSTKNQQRTA